MSLISLPRCIEFGSFDIFSSLGSSSSGARLEDFPGSHHDIVVTTQLRETIEGLKKQVISRDLIIKQKDQKVI